MVQVPVVEARILLLGVEDSIVDIVVANVVDSSHSDFDPEGLAVQMWQVCQLVEVAKVEGQIGFEGGFAARKLVVEVEEGVQLL